MSASIKSRRFFFRPFNGARTRGEQHHEWRRSSSLHCELIGGNQMISRGSALAIAGTLLFAACSERADSPVAPGASADAASTAKTWVVAFKGNGLPANVDKLVADAGGTIVARSPEIGGIAVSSANPNFGAAIRGSSSVQAADPATETRLIEPSADVGITSADNNGGNASPTGSDAQLMPD